jgi:hypothetical protein
MGWSRGILVLCMFLLCGNVGCSTLRVTDPYRTATEQYLLNEAARKSVDRLLTAPLRDRLVFVDTTYLISSSTPPPENLFAVGELRAKLLEAGARLTDEKSRAQVVLELRAVGIGIDRLETLIGLPSVAVPTGNTANVPILTPELAIIKRLKQGGFASIAYVAFWRDSGEIVTSSGPFLGTTYREDFWILGFGPRTIGNVAPAKDTGKE